MLDPDEVANFEAWRETKLLGSVDLSVHAYNVEQEGAALAYEAGVRDAVRKTAEGFSVNAIIAASPYRGRGMAGERTTMKKIAPITEEEETE